MTDTDNKKRLAVVLSGGGVCGIAWETGVLKGLRDSGVDLTNADLFVGTSAGSVVGSQIATNCDLDALYAHQSRDWNPSEQAASSTSISKLFLAMIKAWRPWRSLPSRLAQIGSQAIAADVAQTEDQRLSIISERLPVKEWPQNRRLLITAIDCADGSLVVWNKDAGISLANAVASSCAIPMLVRPLSFNGKRYMDGGVHSPTNADLANGYERVVIIAVGAPFMPYFPPLSSEISKLESNGSQVVLIMPDGASRAAIFPNPTESRRRQPSARAGLAQGANEASSVTRALAATAAELAERDTKRRRRRLYFVAAALVAAAGAAYFWLSR